VVLALAMGLALTLQRAPRAGLARAEVARVIAWVLVAGLVGSHVYQLVVYAPERLRANPLALLAIWGPMSSFGGLLGGLAAALWLTRAYGSAARSRTTTPASRPTTRSRCASPTGRASTRDS
jgi:prolipoprotein diacylglyceryltransferase